MPRRKKPEFNLTADLEKFKYEVADEIAINNKKNGSLIPAPNTQQDNKK